MKNEEQEIINSICHKNNICFIGANVYGLAVRVFCDFGDSFTVTDYDDSEPVSTLVGDISKVYALFTLLLYRIQLVSLPLLMIVILSKKVIWSLSLIFAVWLN